MSTVNPKTLVVDVDDTISTHVNRDYENAIPHWDIIQKINRLREAGWYVIYFTARGTVSCDGDLERIERERRPVLESWMSRNDVQYDELRFGKPLGVYYIDDKSIRPDEFMAMEYKEFYGGSGGQVEVLGDRIIKTATNATAQAEWYRLARRHVRTPKIHSAYGNIIEMELVQGRSMNEEITPEKVDLLYSFASTIIPSVNPGYEIPTWSTMVERLQLASYGFDYPYKTEFFDTVDRTSMHVYMNARRSFSHGDLTLENIIEQEDGGVVFIDPNYSKDLYSSKLLDYAKLLQSLKFSYEEKFGGGFNFSKKSSCDRLEEHLNREGLNYNVMGVLCMSHFVRMLRYKKTERDQEVVRKIIQGIGEHVFG